MGRSYVDQVSEYIFNIAAGDAADTTYTKYIDARGYRRGAIQVNWTAGAGGGTLVFKCYATTFEFQNEAAATEGDSGDIFQDVSNTILGSPTLTGDSYITDSDGLVGCNTWLKFTGTIANKDASTSLVCRINKCS